jgi:hypothetical protein
MSAQHNKLLRQKYRRFRAKLLNNMLEVSEKDQQNFGKFPPLNRGLMKFFLQIEG